MGGWEVGRAGCVCERGRERGSLCVCVSACLNDDCGVFEGAVKISLEIFFLLYHGCPLMCVCEYVRIRVRVHSYM